MKELAFRLHRGDDLREKIEEKCIDINTAVLISGVGCLSSANIRLAKAVDYLKETNDYEIVSLNGTISNGKAHLHISLSDEKGNVIGGHLEKGCIINTTCEVVLGILEEYKSIREYDQATRYDEIAFSKSE